MARPTTKRQIREAVSALERIEEVSGRISKESVLGEAADNPILRQMFLMALGGDMYHVRPTGNIVSTPSITDEREAWARFVKLTDELRTRQLTGNSASMTTDRFLMSVPVELAKWFRRILTHDLRIGVSEKTLSKIWGRSFWETAEEKSQGWSYRGCMLAKKYEDVCRNGQSPSFPIAVEPKLDGERALLFCFPADRRIYVLTRGKKRRETIEAVSDFMGQILAFAPRINAEADIKTSSPVFLDGEFLAVDGSWNRTSSIVRATKNFKPSLFLDEIRCVLFDWAPLDAYMSGKFDVSWKRRKRALVKAAGLERFRSRATKVSTNVWVLGHRIVMDDVELRREYERLLDIGHEGIMVKALDAPHVFKRTDTCLKLKPEDEATGTILEVVSGEGKHAPAGEKDVRRSRKIMREWGEVTDDGHYLHCRTKHPKAAAADIRKAVKDDADRRISLHREGRVSFRHSGRLGYFVVESGDRKFHVGGGFTHAAGNDQRMEFWRERGKLVGMKIDFKIQRDKKEVAIGRFNRFVRLREDLS